MMKRKKIKMLKRVRKRAEFISLSKERTTRSNSLPESKKNTQKKKESAAAGIGDKVPQKDGEAEAAKREGLNTGSADGKGKDNSSKASHQDRNKEPQKKTTFIVLQKNTRSLSSSERLEKMISELHRVEWDAILISGTWRQTKELWETQQGHIMVESGQFINKHGGAILLNKKWKNQINWVQCESERVVAMSISVNKQPIVLMSVYMPHSGYADHHVEKVYKTITKITEREKNMKIIGGDFNAELGPGEGMELSAVGHYTLNKGRELQRRMDDSVATPEQTGGAEHHVQEDTTETSDILHIKRSKKQQDYILTDRKHYKWSRDAEASDTIHMGSDHRCVTARFEIPQEKEQGNPRKTKAPVIEQQSEKSDDEKQQKYLELEQRVKEAEPGKNTKSAAEEKDEAGVAAANQEEKAEEHEGKAKAYTSAAPAAAAAADEGTEQRCTAALEGTAASEAEGRNEKDERIRALVQQRKTIAKDKKDRIREISKEIKKCIRDNKRLKRQEKIQKNLEKVKGTKKITNIKSVKKRILIPRVKNKEGEVVKTRQGIDNVFAQFYEELYEGEDEYVDEDVMIGAEGEDEESEQSIKIKEFTTEEIQSAIDRLKKGKAQDSSGVRAEQLKL